MQYNIEPCSVNLQQLAPSQSTQSTNRTNDLRALLNNKIASDYGRPGPKSVKRARQLQNENNNNGLLPDASSIGNNGVQQNKTLPTIVPLSNSPKSYPKKGETKQQNTIKDTKTNTLNNHPPISFTEDQLLADTASIDDADSITTSLCEYLLRNEEETEEKNVDFETMSIMIDEDDRQDDDLDNDLAKASCLQKNGLKRNFKDDQVSITDKMDGWHKRNEDDKLKPKLKLQKRTSLSDNREQKQTKPKSNKITYHVKGPPLDEILKSMPCKKDSSPSRSPKTSPKNNNFTAPLPAKSKPQQKQTNHNKGHNNAKRNKNGKSNQPPNFACFAYWDTGECHRQSCNFNHVDNPEIQRQARPLPPPAPNRPLLLPPPSRPLPPPGGYILANPPPPQITGFPLKGMPSSLDRLNEIKSTETPKANLGILFDSNANSMSRKVAMRHLDNMQLNAQDHSAFMAGLERFIIELSSSSTGGDGKKLDAKIGYDVIEVKRKRETLKGWDLYYCIKLQVSNENYKTAFDLLKEWTFLAEFNDETMFNKWLEACNLCIESKGLIFSHWNEFKTMMLDSEDTVKMLLSKVEVNLLREKMSKNELEHVYQLMLKGNIILSNEEMKKFLMLYSPTASRDDLLDLLAKRRDMDDVPKECLNRILSPVWEDVPSSVFDLLRRLPATVLCESSAAWNELMVECCKRKGTFSQIAMQIYIQLKAKCISPTAECAYYLLDDFCSKQDFEQFVKMTAEFEKNVFNDESEAPDWFALKLTNILNNYGGDDQNFILKIVSFLLTSSSRQPEEQIVINLIDMLIRARMFSELLNLIKKCGRHSFILKEGDLRRVVFHLEEWTSNPEASVHVYALTRKLYPRATEFYCVKCHTCRKTSRNSSVRSRDESPIKLNGSRDSVSSSHSKYEQVEESDDDMYEPIDDEEEPDVVSKESPERRLLKLGAQITCACKENDEDSLYASYLETLDIDSKNFNCTMNAVFIGLLLNEQPVEAFKKYIAVSKRVIGDNIADERDIRRSMGQVGIRLIRCMSNRQQYENGYNVLAALHASQIEYLNCGASYGNQIDTSDVITTSDILSVCCSLCIHCRTVESAENILKHNLSLLKLDELEACELSKISQTAKDVILAKSREKPQGSWPLYKELAQKLNFCEETRCELINSVCEQCFHDNLPLAVELYTILKNEKYALAPNTQRAYIENLSQNKKSDLADELFTKAITDGIYKDPFVYSEPFCMEVSKGLRHGEMFLTIKYFLNKLGEHPFFKNKSLSENPLKIVIVPKENIELSEIPKVVSECKNMVMDALAEFTPKLEFNAQDQLVSVHTLSIKRWWQSKHRQHKATQQQLSERKRRFIQQKGGRVEGKPNIAMTICPTPQHVTDSTDAPDEPSCPKTNGTPSGKRAKKRVGVAEKDVRGAVKKCICKHLTTLMKEGEVTRESFGNMAKNLHVNFLNKLKADGKMRFDAQVKKDVITFVDSQLRNT